jgi:molybdopterin-guanine dinucleotide biosynthesis protein A
MPEHLTPEQIRQTCALVVLAGGKSSRMGRPKAWLPFRGQPMLARVLDRLSPLFEEQVVVRAPGQDLPDVETRFVEDEQPGMGPVAGLAVGLAAVTRPLAFAVSCDAPFVQPKVVAHLVERCRPPFGVVVPVWEDRPQPLHAVYRADNAPILRRLLAAGRRRPIDLFVEVPALEVTEAEIRALDPDGLTFMNTNTPEEWERAVALGVALEGAGISPQRHRDTEEGSSEPEEAGIVVAGRGQGTLSISVELLGLARLLGRRETVELRVSPDGQLARVVRALGDAVPALVGVAIDVRGERLMPGYVLYRNGREPLRGEEVSLAPGDQLLLLSAEVGG